MSGFLNCLLIFVMSLEIKFNYQELGEGGGWKPLAG